MGIYTTGNIYGIKILWIEDDVNEITHDVHILIEMSSDILMTEEKKKEVRLLYDGLNENEKQKVVFEIYTEGYSTYSHDDSVFMMWDRIPLEFFIRNFST